MKDKKVLKPNVVAGGTAIPLGRNFYYMSGKKHTDGGIDIGPNNKNGLEVEDQEIMHLTPSEVKVFSSVPFLNGKSPAQKVLQGDNPTKVFNAQQQYKKSNNIKDDGTSKQNGGKMKVKKYANGGRKNYSTPDDYMDPINTNNNFDDTTINNTSNSKPSFINKTLDSVGNYYKNNPNALGDTIGVGSNIIGSILSNRANNKMLDKLKYPNAPISRQATKLKTTININPQLDKMRESLASYENDINNNTASSRVALARKQRGRVAGMLQTNELYGNKENAETELINKDKYNQQQVANSNTEDYNRWSEGKTAFNNTIAEKRSENNVDLISNINKGVQDVINKGQQRDSNKNNMLVIAAAHPNVNPMILKQLGVTSITDKMIEDWNKANLKKGKKTNNNTD